MKNTAIRKSVILTLLALLLVSAASCGRREAPPEEEPPAGEALVQEPEETAPSEPEAEQEPKPAPEPAPEPDPEPMPEPEPEPAPAPEAPNTLAALLEAAGQAPENIPGSQLVIVRASGNESELWAYGLEDGVWTPFFEEVSGHVGKNGVTDAKTEGDRCTPRGLFNLSMAFGVEADPGSLLPYRQVTSESYWVDDPDSRFYNQWVEGTEEKDWSSAEHLADYPVQYAYAALIDYNTDPVAAGAGSAIFLHCGSSYTAGCVSISREKMLDLLLWLDPGQSPAILIF